jgi:hypothetical protein
MTGAVATAAGVFAVSLLVLVGTSSPGAAQGWQRSAIVGTVRDPSGAVIRDATVTLSGEVLGGARSIKTDDNGHYRFTGLLPGRYRISAVSDGFVPTSTQEFALPVETTYSVDLTLELPLVAEQVSVIDQRPLLDVHATAPAITYTFDLLQQLPSARSFGAVLNLAPGVVEDVAFGGTQSSSNRLSLDGVVVNASYLGEQWVRPHYNWFSEVQIVGGSGASAEYSGFTGAIANAVLRSGGNRYSGLVDYLTIRPTWSDDNTGSLPAGAARPTPRTIIDWRDIDLQGGGPIKRDRVWLFGGFSHVDHEYRNFGHKGPETTHETAPKWMVKADAAAAAGIYLQGYFLEDSSDVIGFDLDSIRPTYESASDVRQRKHAWNVRATWTRGDRTILAVRSGGHFGTNGREPHPPGTRTGPHAVRDQNGIVSRNSPIYVRTDSEAVATAASLTRYIATNFGTHEFRSGAEVEWNSGLEESGYTAGAVHYYADGNLVFADVWEGDRIRTENRRITFYLQDRWTFGDVTVEPGVNIAFYNGSVPDSGDVFTTRPVGARLGAAWDIGGKHGTVVRGHYGRSHDPQFGYLYGFADRAERTPILGVEFLPDGSALETSRIDPDVTTTIDGALDQPHVDQWSAAIEQRIGDDLTVQAQYVRREFGNFIGYMDPRISEWVAFTVTDPGPDGRLRTADDGGPLTGYVPYPGPRVKHLGNVPDAWRSYQALQLIIRKRLADRWQMEASITTSRSTGTVDTVANTNIAWASLSPGGIGADGELRATARRRPTHDFSEAKVLGTYDAPWLWGIRTSGIFRWRNGTRWHRLMRAGSPYFTNLPAEEPNSRRTPNIRKLDLRFEKLVPLPVGYGHFGFYVDIFNVTNEGRALSFTRMSGPAFGTPSGWTEPRTVQAGIRYTF